MVIRTQESHRQRHKGGDRGLAQEPQHECSVLHRFRASICATRVKYVSDALTYLVHGTSARMATLEGKPVSPAADTPPAQGPYTSLFLFLPLPPPALLSEVPAKRFCFERVDLGHAFKTILLRNHAWDFNSVGTVLAYCAQYHVK